MRSVVLLAICFLVACSTAGATNMAETIITGDPINLPDLNGGPPAADAILYEDTNGDLQQGPAVSDLFVGFDFAGDLGTPQTVGDGDAILIIGGAGIETTASATDTLSIALDQGLTLFRRAVSDADFTALLTNVILAETTLTATRTISLPSCASCNAGKVYIIKDESGSCSPTVKIIIDAAGADTIDGAGSYDLTIAYSSISIYTDGNSKWFIF